MRSNYEEKRANRLERYERLAAKFQGESVNRFKRFHDLLSVIPMGQPILVGHHSEKGHRSLLNKADNSMRASIEADKKAAYYSDRAETLENNNAISSDDPNAIERLTVKLAHLVKTQEFMKKVNAAHAKYLKKPASLELSDLSEEWKKKIMEYVPEYSWLKHPFAPYRLTNNNASIATVRQRLAKLQKIEEAGNEEKFYGEIRVFANADENRVQMFFPGKPSDEVRKSLKGYGFRWTPTVGCWQAFYSNRAKWAAVEIVKLVK